MMKADKALEKFKDSHEYSLEFALSEDIVNEFSILTSDHSSLHINKEFGRRSMFRRNIVHGLIQISFLAFIEELLIKDMTWSIRKISANFLKPAFIGDKMNLTLKTIDIFENIVRFEFLIRKTHSKIITASGTILLSYSLSEPKINDILREESPVPKLVCEEIRERCLYIEQINKDEEYHFQFRPTKRCAEFLFGMLSKSVQNEKRISFDIWIKGIDYPNILSLLLNSTLIGMGTPGKSSTLANFSTEYEERVQRDTLYIFSGKVNLVSKTSETVVQSVKIVPVDDSEKIIGTGRISAKVNEAPVNAPSISTLQSECLNFGIEGKVVVITGASRGVGETTAKIFSLYGAKVVINYFSGIADANRIVDEIIQHGGEAIAIKADVSDERQVKDMISSIKNKYGRIDVLINNAVRDTIPVPFLELSWDDVQKDIDVIIKGAFNCCREIIPIMLESGGGKIINISTIYAEYPVSNQLKYVVSKSGLAGLTRSLAIEFAEHNIQVNMVVPTIMKTDLSSNIPKIHFDSIKNSQPMKRLAKVEDVAKTIIFLASSLCSFTTGQKIMVTGGSAPFL